MYTNAEMEEKDERQPDPIMRCQLISDNSNNLLPLQPQPRISPNFAQGDYVDTDDDIAVILAIKESQEAFERELAYQQSQQRVQELKQQYEAKQEAKRLKEQEDALAAKNYRRELIQPIWVRLCRLNAASNGDDEYLERITNEFAKYVEFGKKINFWDILELKTYLPPKEYDYLLTLEFQVFEEQV